MAMPRRELSWWAWQVEEFERLKNTPPPEV